MREVILGRTGIKTQKNGFGALPIQRVSFAYADRLLKAAYTAGITFFDTARGYSDSEEKIGHSLGSDSNIRQNITIATKSFCKTAEAFWSDLHKSLSLLKTDYIDLYQFHNPSFCPKPDDGSGLYEAAIKAKAQGKIRFIGLTNHRLDVAQEAVLSGLYDTLQFPFCYLAQEKDIEIMQLCKTNDIGFIAMKALSGGLIGHADTAYAWIDQFDHVLPIWGVQKQEELDDFIGFISNPPVLDKTHIATIEQDRKTLAGNFCRACGYCMPCPAGIQINMCARMAQLIRRSPSEHWLDEKGQEMMRRIERCTNCGSCVKKCPYNLNPPQMLREHYADYRDILAGHIDVTDQK